MKNLVAGIDIGGTNTVFALVDEAGISHGTGTFPTNSHTQCLMILFIAYIEMAYRDISLKLLIEHKILGIRNWVPLTAIIITGLYRGRSKSDLER